MDLAVLLSGEHPTLPRAELEALLAVHDPDARIDGGDTIARVTCGGGDAAAALSRMALAHAWGELWCEDEDTDSGIARLADCAQDRCDGDGTLAVVTERRGTDKSPNTRNVLVALGDAARAAGHRIDLKRPDHRLFAWFLDTRITAGRLLGAMDRSQYQERILERRAHFRPVGMHPRRAASLVHLARVAPGGTVYDPFCGTGGLLLEAALDGHRVIGSDRDPVMVQGTYHTLTDLPPEPAEADIFVADVGEAPALVEQVDGIVTDLPYGRASGTDREPLVELYKRALDAFADVLAPGGHAVVGCADPALLPDHPVLERCGQHEEHAHKSLTRHFVIMKRKGAVASTA